MARRGLPLSAPLPAGSLADPTCAAASRSLDLYNVWDVGPLLNAPRQLMMPLPAGTLLSWSAAAQRQTVMSICMERL